MTEEYHTWRGRHGIEAEYAVSRGEPATDVDPPTEDDIILHTLSMHGHDIGEMCDILEDNGARIWEPLQDIIREAGEWRH